MFVSLSPCKLLFYAHADDLGDGHLGAGSCPRLRFDPD